MAIEASHNGTTALHAFQHGTSRALVAIDIAPRVIHVDDIAQPVIYDLKQREFARQMWETHPFLP